MAQNYFVPVRARVPEPAPQQQVEPPPDQQQQQAHVRDESLDNGVSDFVLVEVDMTTQDHDHDHELFDRNNVKKDVFHVLKDYQEKLKKRHAMFDTFMAFLRRHAWPHVFWLCSSIAGTLTERSIGVSWQKSMAGFIITR
jgi:hypothetical protein